MHEPKVIDTHMHGRSGITAAFIVQGEKTALVETGPKTSVDHVLEGLAAEGVETLDWILVTHIHLDHAGAAGTIARRFPEATVAVHPVGAPHLADPAKLWSSASRIYGDAMEKMWGGIDPIPAERIHVLEDGDKVDLGGRSLQAIETPGHAYHHHAYLDDATGLVLTGDALGVRLPEVGVIRPATPPPEWHVEKAIASITRLKDLDPTSLWLTHFGPHDRGKDPASVAETCDRAVESIHQWEMWVEDAQKETDDLDDATSIVRARARKVLEEGLTEDLVDRMEQTTSYRMNVSGFLRYLKKRDEAA